MVLRVKKRHPADPHWHKVHYIRQVPVRVPWIRSKFSSILSQGASRHAPSAAILKTIQKRLGQIVGTKTAGRPWHNLPLRTRQTKRSLRGLSLRRILTPFSACVSIGNATCCSWRICHAGRHARRIHTLHQSARWSHLPTRCVHPVVARRLPSRRP
eukprot:SAG11_NODE_6571_length_1286_cov_3.796967_1_plen_156_part_00